MARDTSSASDDLLARSIVYVFDQPELAYLWKAAKDRCEAKAAYGRDDTIDYGHGRKSDFLNFVGIRGEWAFSRITGAKFNHVWGSRYGDGGRVDSRLPLVAWIPEPLRGATVQVKTGFSGLAKPLRFNNSNARAGASVSARFVALDDTSVHFVGYATAADIAERARKTKDGVEIAAEHFRDPIDLARTKALPSRYGSRRWTLDKSDIEPAHEDLFRVWGWPRNLPADPRLPTPRSDLDVYVSEQDRWKLDVEPRYRKSRDADAPQLSGGHRRG